MDVMMKVPEKSGIYRIIVNSPKGIRVYIGQAKNLKRRKKDHFVHLRMGDHKNLRMQRAFYKYGEKAFSFEVVLVTTPDRMLLASLEKSILYQDIDRYGSDAVYNIQRVDMTSLLGVAKSEETKKKQSDAMRGRPRTKSQIEAVRRANRTRIVSEETKKKMSLAHTGNKYALGWKQSSEHRSKVGAFFKGRKRDPQDLKKAWATRRANKANINGNIGA